MGDNYAEKGNDETPTTPKPTPFFHHHAFYAYLGIMPAIFSWVASACKSKYWLLGFWTGCYAAM
jgi:hypothetical protein